VGRAAARGFHLVAEVALAEELGRAIGYGLRMRDGVVVPRCSLAQRYLRERQRLAR
jgi:hypothetical protein